MNYFPAWPQFDSQSIKDATDILSSGKVNYWTGNKGKEFEQSFSQWIGAKYSISCSSGTAALHTAISSLGIGPGDEVIVPSYTFIATSFAVLQAGAIPIFCDVSLDHTIDPNKIKFLITNKTKAIIVVHLYGIVCDMDSIIKIAKQYKLKIIEDAAQCLGGVYKGKKVGTIGDVGAFSFCQSKHFTTAGEGGMIVNNDESLSWECKSFRDHGFDVKKKINLIELEEQSFHVHNRIGFNFRMTEIQSAIGINELNRFDSWNLLRRKHFAKIYDSAFIEMDDILSIPFNSDERENAYWIYPVVINRDRIKGDASIIITELKKINIPAFKIQWPEAYIEKVYRELKGFGSANFPFQSREYTSPESVDYNNVFCEVANSLLPVTFSLYLHPTWDDEHIYRCINGVKQVLRSLV